MDEFAIELERLAPATDTGAPDWADVQRRAGRSPRQLVTLLLAAALAVAVPAIALSSDLRLALGIGHPRPILTRATVLVSGPVGNGFFAHGWRAPSTTGGSCVFLAYDHSPTAQKKAHPTRWSARLGGGMCSEDPQDQAHPSTAAHPLLVTLSMQRRLKAGNPRNWVPPVLFGSVYPVLHATRVAVVWKGGSHDLALKDDWFIGGSTALYVPPFKRFPFFVVAYDAAGKEVARQRLESPTLRMVNGWKAYARAYHAWRKLHP